MATLVGTITSPYAVSSAYPIVSAFPTSTSASQSTFPSSFLPLTTAFSVPTSCFKELYTVIFTSPDLTAFRDYGAVHSVCYPESYSDFEYPTIHPESSWYSPGVCPSGYPVASWYYDFQASATRAWCCPGTQSEWWVPTFPWGGNGGRRVCISTVTTSTSLVLPGQSTLLTDFFSAYDWPISVMWAESDLTKLAPTSLPSPANNGSAAPSPGSGSGTSPSTPLPPNPSRLSTGAKAGIGVGIAILILALLAVGFVFYRRRNPKLAQQPADMVQIAPAAGTDPREGMKHRPAFTEMDASNAHTEMDSNNTRSTQHTAPSELDGRGMPAYMPYKPGN